MTPTRLTSRQMRETGWNPADESWAYASADAPTYVITVPSDATTKYSPGMRIQLTQPTDGVKYFIVTAVSATTLTVYGGTDYDLDNEAITLPNYSIQKGPFGFPLDPDKWTEELTNSGDVVQGTAAGVWYNLGSLSLDIPIGVWDVAYQLCLDFSVGSGGGLSDGWSSLSTTTNSETDDEWTGHYREFWDFDTQTTTRGGTNVYRRKILALAVKDTYYLVAKSTFVGSLRFLGTTGGATMIRATCAYL